MKKRTVIFMIIGLWLLIAVGVILVNQYTLLTGTRVLLKTAPLDPRDFLRGDYVILRYEISRLDLNKIPSSRENFAKGNKIYLILEKDGIYWVPKEIRDKKPEGQGVFLTGEVTWFDKDAKLMDVIYGIENYFVSEGQGKKIEALMGENLGVEVSLDKNGRAVILQLYLDGEVLQIE